MNVEWDILKRSFEHLCRHIERARGIVDQDSKPNEPAAGRGGV